GGVLASFFFSSRRRHTRFSRDWSSDVCSSDLPELLVVAAVIRPLHNRPVVGGRPVVHVEHLVRVPCSHAVPPTTGIDELPLLVRSEERRVGKEYRHRSSPINYERLKNEGRWCV